MRNFANSDKAESTNDFLYGTVILNKKHRIIRASPNSNVLSVKSNPD